MQILDWRRWLPACAIGAVLATAGLTTLGCDSEPELPSDEQSNLCDDTEACAACNSADCQESVDVACQEAQRVPAQSFCDSCHSETD